MRLPERHCCAKIIFASKLYSPLRQTPSQIFSVVNVNSILSQNQIKLTSIGSSFEQLRLE